MDMREINKNLSSLPYDESERKHHSEIRPLYLSDFIGHRDIVRNLEIFIHAAKGREESVDHILFHGPPGLGKTTLSQIIANEMGVKMKQSVGPALSKTGDLAAILTSLSDGDILFIDEVHRMNASVEEMLYSAMEDFAIDIVIGEGPGARAMRLTLPRFTLVAATTRLGLLSKPFKDRFGIPLKLDFYADQELSQIIARAAKLLGMCIDERAIFEIARRARGTPRVALRLLRRVRDFAAFYQKSEVICEGFANETLNSLNIDNMGLDSLDYKYIKYIQQEYEGGPVGIETIAAGLFEDKDTLEESIEPYLMQIGFLNRTSRGRQLSLRCLEHLREDV